MEYVLTCSRIAVFYFDTCDVIFYNMMLISEPIENLLNKRKIIQKILDPNFQNININIKPD